jgi:DNA-binding NtrC family response regulator
MEESRSAERLPSEHAVTLLAVGSEEEDLFHLRNICAGAGWTLHEAHGLRQALAQMRQNAIPVVLCPHKMADGGWMELLDTAAALPEPSRVIVWARDADAALWAEVLNLGGYDVLAAPFRVAEVVHAVRAAMKNWREPGGSAAKRQALVPAA